MRSFRSWFRRREEDTSEVPPDTPEMATASLFSPTTVRADGPSPAAARDGPLVGAPAGEAVQEAAEPGVAEDDDEESVADLVEPEEEAVDGSGEEPGAELMGLFEEESELDEEVKLLSSQVEDVFARDLLADLHEFTQSLGLSADEDRTLLRRG